MCDDIGRLSEKYINILEDDVESLVQKQRKLIKDDIYVKKILNNQDSDSKNLKNLLQIESSLNRDINEISIEILDRQESIREKNLDKEKSDLTKINIIREMHPLLYILYATYENKSIVPVCTLSENKYIGIPSDMITGTKYHIELVDSKNIPDDLILKLNKLP